MAFLNKYLLFARLCDDPLDYEYDEVGGCVGIHQWDHFHSPIDLTLPDMYVITASTWLRSTYGGNANGPQSRSFSDGFVLYTGNKKHNDCAAPNPVESKSATRRNEYF
eukprot:3821969-Ditylum_brightwellii.AAC.1